MIKLSYSPIWILFSYLTVACNNGTSAHKNNDTKLKSATTIVSTAELNSSKSIAENISVDSSFSLLDQSLKLTGLAELLTKPGPFTVFAPVNSAFEKLPQGTLEGLMQDRKDDLANILSYHIVAGQLEKNHMKAGQKLKTVAGEELIVTKRKGDIIINGVRINTAGIRNSNGIIYVVNDLLFPKNQNPGAY
jgi:uncharacterized surface protein with fasciclin (FAS1) repeats